MKIIIGLSSALLLAGCAATAPPQPSVLSPSAADFRYFAPKTKLALQGDLVLISCDSADALLVAPNLSIAQSGGADEKAEFRLSGSELMSALQKRELTIDLSDARTIKSLSASSSDRSGAVVTNVLKLFATVAGAVVGAGAPGEASSPCNDATNEALTRAQNLTSEIVTARAKLIGASPADAVKISKQVDVLAAQLAAEMTGPLTISVTRPLKIGEQQASDQDIRWTLSDLGKWFAQDSKRDPCTAHPGAGFVETGTEKGCDATTAILAMKFSITGVPSPTPAAKSPCLNPGADLRSVCGRTIVLVDPVMAKVTLNAVNSHYLGHTKGDELGSANAPIAQWGTATYLPLDVRFAQSRTVGMTFDQFGRKQSFSWNSEASAENATGTFATIAESGVAAVKATRAPEAATEVELWEAEAVRLETRLKLNKLVACQAVIEAGGTVCPSTD